MNLLEQWFEFGEVDDELDTLTNIVLVAIFDDEEVSFIAIVVQVLE